MGPLYGGDRIVADNKGEKLNGLKVLYFNIEILKVANYIKCNTDVPGDYVEYNNEEKWFMSILFSLPITISFSILLTIRRECRNGRKESDVVRTLL